MKILVACEYSGRVRDAFITKGHNAISCDLLDSQSPGPHYKGDVRDILNNGWDMMIAFPPCTWLTNMGTAQLRWDDSYHIERKNALDFVSLLLDADIPKIALENPVGAISTNIQKPTQIIQPWWFGDPYTKKTCLWLKGLPILTPGDNWCRTERISYLDCAHKSIRSLTFRGIANAMAEQWG